MRNITVFIPAVKGRVKTKARGFWVDNGKTYYDYVKPVTMPFVSVQSIKAEVERLRVQYNQLAMFYITLDAEGDNASAYIQSADKLDRLSRFYSVYAQGAVTVRHYVKKFLRDCGGCTVYDLGNRQYCVECFVK